MAGNGDAVRVPRWVMPSIMTILTGLTVGLGAKVWDMSDEIIRNGLAIEELRRWEEQSRYDHNTMIQMGSDLNYIKQKITDIEKKLPENWVRKERRSSVPVP